MIRTFFLHSLSLLVRTKTEPGNKVTLNQHRVPHESPPSLCTCVVSHVLLTSLFTALCANGPLLPSAQSQSTKLLTALIDIQYESTACLFWADVLVQLGMLRFREMDDVSCGGHDLKRVLPCWSLSLLADKWIINSDAGKGPCWFHDGGRGGGGGCVSSLASRIQSVYYPNKSSIQIKLIIYIYTCVCIYHSAITVWYSFQYSIVSMVTAHSEGRVYGGRST